MVERESHWLPTDIEGLAALDLYRTKVCKGCGLHHDLLHNPDLQMRFDEDFCPGCRGVAKYDRMRKAADERLMKSLGKDPDPKQPRPTDGRRTTIRLTARDGGESPATGGE